MFSANADHFGPGFFPLMAWILTLPFGGPLFALLVVVQCYRYKTGAFGNRFKAWRLSLWFVATIIWGYIFIVFATRDPGNAL